MIAKLIYLVGILQFPIFGFSQKAEQSKCSGYYPLLKNDSVYIKTMQGKRVISRRFFRRRFEIAVSNGSYSVVGFYINWNDSRAKIYKRGNRGSKVLPESEKKTYSLKNLEPGVIIAFDCIVLKKGNEYFKSLPLVYYVDN